MTKPQARRFDGRQADLAAIHIAKKTLRWSEDEYRDVMATVCAGIRSSALLDVTGRKRLLAHLQACLRANGGGAGTKVAKSPDQARKALSGRPAKMWSLWMQLADAGLVQARTMAALCAFGQRQTGVARLEWMNAHQQDLVVESLKRWLERGE